MNSSSRIGGLFRDILDYIKGVATKVEEDIAQIEHEVNELNESLNGNSMIESFNQSEYTNSYNFISFIPEDQLPIQEIKRVNFQAALQNKSGLFIAAFSLGVNNSFTCTKKTALTWNASFGYYDTDLTIGNNEYYGFVFNVLNGTVSKNNSGVSDYYLIGTVTINAGDSRVFTHGLAVRTYYSINNKANIVWNDEFEAYKTEAAKEVNEKFDSIEEALEMGKDIIGVDSSEWDSLSSGGAISDAAYYKIPASFDGIITSITFPNTRVAPILLSVKNLTNWYESRVSADENKIELEVNEVGNVTLKTNIPVKYGQYIGITRGSVPSGFKYKFGGVGSNWYFAFNAVVESRIGVAINEAKEISEDALKVVGNASFRSYLSPCMLFFDNFATNKEIEVLQDNGSNYESVKISAWENVGWVKGIEETILSYITPTEGAGYDNNHLTHQHTYTCEYRKHRYLIRLSALDSIIAVQTSQTNTTEGNSTFIFDFYANKMQAKNSSSTLLEKNISFTPGIGKMYWIEIMRTSYGFGMSIIDTANSNNYTEFVVEKTRTSPDTYNWAMASVTGKFSIYLESGTAFKLYEHSITTEGRNADLYITGDSIAAGAGLYNDERWATLVKNQIKNCVISARGTSNFNEVILRLTSEVEFLRPKILLSANGFNGSVTQKYINALASFCDERDIIYCQTMITSPDPRTKAANAVYMQQNRQTVRFDIACCIDFDLTKGMDYSKWPDGVHPDAAGSVDLANRVLIDLPQLVNSYNK
jgi:hypothetical protein